MPKKITLFLLITFFALHTIAQNYTCFEKCNRPTQTLNRVDGANYYQYPQMQRYDIKYLKLDLAAETNNRNISGSTFYIVKVLQNIDTFEIEFKNTMTLDSVFINGIKKNFTRQNDHIFIYMSPMLMAGDLVNALFYHRGIASSNAVFAGISSSNGLNYTATVSESYQAREWFPSKQLLNDKIDSADIWITTSAANKAGSNGVLLAIVDKPGSKKQFQWKTKYPMNYYMPSIAVGNYMEYKNYAKPAAMAPDSILIQHYLANNPTYFNNVKTLLDKTPACIEKMSELFGLYPFKNEKYGHAQASIGGGMEHQTMSTMQGFSDLLIIHELAHQWFGDNVTCATWNDIWLNEGFATYSEYLMYEKLPALFSITAADYMNNLHDDIISFCTTGSVFVPNEYVFDENRIFDYFLSYQKGAAILHTLRFEMQNDNLFFQTVKNYQQQFKDSFATATDFKNLAEAISGKNLTDFFNQWYYGEGYPTYHLNYYKTTDTLYLTLSQTTSAPAVTPFFKGLIQFKILSPTGDEYVTVHHQYNHQLFKIYFPKNMSGIEVDPYNWIVNRVGSIVTKVTDVTDASDAVKLYPIPAKNQLNLAFPVNWFEDATITDIAGKQITTFIIKKGKSFETLRVNLPNGMYYLQMKGKTKQAQKKIIIAQ